MTTSNRILALSAVALCSIAVINALPGAVKNSPSKSTTYLRPCYFTNWAQYRPGRGKYVPEDYIPGLCTHILYAFAVFGSDFKAHAFDPADLPGDWSGANMYARVNKWKQTDHGLKTILSFGGWNFGPAPFKAMASTANNRATFIQSAIAFVRQYDFDGIDIDWEYPDGPEDTNNYVQLFKEMRAAAEQEASQSGKDRLLVTAAVAAGKVRIDAGFDIANMAPHMDFINLMSYDFHGTWEQKTGLCSPLYSRADEDADVKVLNMDFAASYWAQKGMPKAKIVVGMAMYGRGWTLSNPSNNGLGAPGTAARPTPYAREAGMATYYELCEMVASGAHVTFQEEQKAPYLVKGDQWFGYDDVESITTKMDWLKHEGYGGAMIWALDLDDFNGGCSNGNGKLYPLLSVIAQELGGIDVHQSTRQPATTTTTRPGGGPTHTTQRPQTGGTDPSGGFRCPGDGYFPDPASCKSFYECANGIPYKYHCPAGTIYNPDRKYCDWPANTHSECIVEG